MSNDKKEELIELLANEDFKRWVLEPTYERDIFWLKWLDNNPGKEEIVNAAKEFIRSAKYPKRSLKPEVRDEILSNIILHTPSNGGNFHYSTVEKRKPFLREYIYKTAAAVLILVTFSGLMWWGRMQEQRIEESVPVAVRKENPSGRKSVLVLPDGSKVTLNAASVLTYSPDFGDVDRTVNIEGEAFFEVKEDIRRPFNVISGNIMTTALGTSFNVRAFQSEQTLKVSLRTGKVKVVNISDDSLEQAQLLEPGEGFVIQKSGRGMEKIDIDPIMEFGWKDGVLVFKGSNLQEVVRSLERWYGVTIEVKGKPSKEWRVDSKFDNESLEQVLQGLSFTYDIDYQISGKNVELKFK